ncbi:unnamed protein product [Rotaria sordida]|uniref:ABC transmembrane type-1 domain-containing protein n=1 Tax=Rotaria sordida TaxID=392033 RepID=A0A819AYQ3_9BILA|nr:unnamed protein product [Rotaria sordida]CAF3791804.1 unnamed protein product [Rotaria sordida]
MPILNGNLKSNGKVTPLNDEPDKQSGVQEIDNTNITIPNNPIEIAQEANIGNLENGLPKIDQNEKESQVKKKPEGPKLKAYEIYKFADKWDILFMILGTIAALASGAAMPIMMWLFQSVANSLVNIGKGNATTATNCYTDSSSGVDPISSIQGIIKWYATLGVASIIVHWMAYGFWMSTTERQLRRIRYGLFESIMRQEIGWFDCLNAGELSSRLIDDLDNIREGIGFRVADFFCLLSRIIATLVFSFYTGWKLTLVFLSISPLIVLSFNLLIRVIVRYTVLELQAYSTANSIAQEVLGAIRTVTAFSGQKKETER